MQEKPPFTWCSGERAPPSGGALRVLERQSAPFPWAMDLRPAAVDDRVGKLRSSQRPELEIQVSRGMKSLFLVEGGLNTQTSRENGGS